MVDSKNNNKDSDNGVTIGAVIGFLLNLFIGNLPLCLAIGLTIGVIFDHFFIKKL